MPPLIIGLRGHYIIRLSGSQLGFFAPRMGANRQKFPWELGEFCTQYRRNSLPWEFWLPIANSWSLCEASQFKFILFACFKIKQHNRPHSCQCISEARQALRVGSAPPFPHQCRKTFHCNEIVRWVLVVKQ